MDLKKSLIYIAFGFLFTLVNINLQFNGAAINVVPDFVGWILFFLAYDKLGRYAEGKGYLKWIALILTIITAVIWIFDFTKPELDIGFLKTAVTALSAVFMFMLFGILEQVAHDNGSSRESTLRMLKIINPILCIAFIATALLAGYVSLEKYALLAGITGTAALVAAIITAVVLFALAKEINQKTAEE